MNKEFEISIILPCLDEEKSVGKCIESIEKTIDKFSLDAEIIVVNNNSRDATKEIAELYAKKILTLRIIEEKNHGYGSACLAGLHGAKGKYLFIADADGTYNFSEIPRFIKKLKDGFDLVVGNRFAGKIKNYSMS